MYSSELFKIVWLLAAAFGGLLSGSLVLIYLKFRKEIKEGEKIRAAQKLHIPYPSPSKPSPQEHEPELVGHH